METVLLVNMGGPSDLNEIKGYLNSIFNDPAILPVPGFIRKPLASYISYRRTPKVAERYRLIGGRSPLPWWTGKLRELVSGELGNHGGNLNVIHAFRYSPPTIDKAIAEAAKNGADEIVLLPLFPHRTGAMTGSVKKAAEDSCRKFNLKLKPVSDWGNRPEIIDLWSGYIDEELKEISGDCYVLFVAHGIPLRDVSRGDPYPELVKETAANLGDKLPAGIGWSLAFQSKVGPVKWTGPYLEDEIMRISKISKNLLIMPLSFVADCLETLYDLDIVASRLAKESGFEQVRRVRVFNDDPGFAKALAAIAQEAM